MVIHHTADHMLFTINISICTILYCVCVPVSSVSSTDSTAVNSPSRCVSVCVDITSSVCWYVSLQLCVLHPPTLSYLFCWYCLFLSVCVCVLYSVPLRQLPPLLAPLVCVCLCPYICVICVLFAYYPLYPFPCVCPCASVYMYVVSVLTQGPTGTG